eukprot:15365789-Ditylum_brightwellii.AAC.2
MVKQHIGTIAGAIYGICVIVVVIVTVANHKMQGAKTCISAPSTPSQPPKNTLFSSSNNNKTQQSTKGAFGSTNRMPWPHDDRHHGAAAPLLTAGAINCPNPCLQPKKNGGVVGGARVQQKGESWGLTGGTLVCPLKPIWWLQRADTFPFTQKG